VLGAQLDAVIESAPFGIGLFDRQLRHVRVNPLLEEMNGLPAAELLGRTPAELHPQVGLEAEVLYREVVESGKPRRDVVLTGELGSRPGDVRHWNASFFPVRHAGEVIGLCVVVADVTVERQLAEALAASEERHRLLAEDLQSSLLPPAMPKLPGVDLAAVYQPGTAVAAVGGDFYDVIELDDSAWLMVIGDVQGKGPIAASLTAAARYAIRTAAVATSEPAAILRTVNEVLLHRGAPDGTCTIACVLAERVGHRILLQSTSAGHPLPLVLRAASGVVEQVGSPGTLLGALADIRLTVSSATLEVGDVLVLYTDGATEARYRSAQAGVQLFGEERLCSLLAAARDVDSAQIAARIADAVLRFQAGRPADDLAVLVLRATDGR